MINPAATFLHLKCRFCCFKRSNVRVQMTDSLRICSVPEARHPLKPLESPSWGEGLDEGSSRVEVGHHSLCVWYVWHKWSKQRDDHSWCSQTTRSSCPLSRPGVLPRHPETAKARTIQSVASAVTPKFFKLLQKAKPLVGLPYYLYVHTAGSTVAE